MDWCRCRCKPRPNHRAATSFRLVCSGKRIAGGRHYAPAPDGRGQQREHRIDGGARQPQGRTDRRGAPDQHQGLVDQRVRGTQLEPFLTCPPRLPIGSWSPSLPA